MGRTLLCLTRSLEILDLQLFGGPRILEILHLQESWFPGNLETLDLQKLKCPGNLQILDLQESECPGMLGAFWARLVVGSWDRRDRQASIRKTMKQWERCDLYKRKTLHDMVILMDFHRLSKLRKIHVNHNRAHFLRFWVPLGISWGRLVTILGRLGINSGLIWVKLEPTWTNMSQTWANLSQLLAALGPTWYQPGPSSVRLEYEKRGKSFIVHCFS